MSENIMIQGIQNNRISCLYKKSYFSWIIFIIAFISLLIPIFYIFKKTGVSADSGYYLSIVNRIAEGYIPYKTISLGYTPLWFYMMAFLKNVFSVSDTNYIFYLCINYLFIFSTSFLIYKIGRILGYDKYAVYFFTYLYILLIQCNQGYYVLLEVPSVFWGIWAIYASLKFKDSSWGYYVFVGLLVSFSFLTKQFGAGFLFLVLYILFFNKQSNRLLKLFAILIGFFIPIIGCFLYWQNDFLPLIFSSYGTTSAAATGYDVSLGAKLLQILDGTFRFIYICPAILVVLLLFHDITHNKKWRETIFYLLGIGGFLMQFYFALFQPHYLIYIFPFACLLLASLFSLENIPRVKKIVYIVLNIIMLLNALFLVYYKITYKQFIQHSPKRFQIEVAEFINNTLEPGDILWTPHGTFICQYFLADVLPPNIESIGYSFGPLALTEEKDALQIEAADYVIRYSEDFPYESHFTDSLKHVLEKYPTIELFDSTVLIHKIIPSFIKSNE